MDKVRVGLIGCGAISGAYLGMAKNFPVLDMALLADLDAEKAKAAAEKYGGQACSVEQLLADPSIEIVLNLTIPKAHLSVGLQAIEAGKHVYVEKPLGVNRGEGEQVLAAAKRKNLRIGCAPDTFMGAGLQTARKVIDDGVIGRPVAFTAFMMGPGHERWHPSPEFYYEVGGGPMFDMGPYYLTALLNLFGPVKRITGLASIAIPERTITSKPKLGQKITVKTPDHISGSIEFENGVMGSIITSFATYFPSFDNKQPITVFGTGGTVRVPDPNQFDGPVHVRKRDEEEWSEIKPSFVTGYGRSVGLADMAYAIRSGRAHRASEQQAFAVLDLMQGFLDSSEQGKAITPVARYERPAPMRRDLAFGTLDE
jgi:predicted dehydrogenase